MITVLSAATERPENRKYQPCVGGGLAELVGRRHPAAACTCVRHDSTVRPRALPGQFHLICLESKSGESKARGEAADIKFDRFGVRLEQHQQIIDQIERRENGAGQYQRLIRSNKTGADAASHFVSSPFNRNQCRRGADGPSISVTFLTLYAYERSLHVASTLQASVPDVYNYIIILKRNFI
ncbi:hypothetical protein EVAR_73132_1 [Eumeta japonica]|uniref:Uncharacterized protein n=1 Tax=Eumeta variegata TaxID=151549 RepID=A0A4C1T3D2_EUMVA|nr:hypothetical protein EVAR_73132_1 [Eumeta japonica]